MPPSDNRTKFTVAYKRLNQAQKQAVDTIEGPVLVLAGPGTGKTQILTLRIANILHQTDTEASSILALTFTDSATREMRSRLIDVIGPAGYHVRVSTFHGFCNDVISAHPDRFSRPAGMRHITDLEKTQIITQILTDNTYLLLRPIGDPLFYLPYLISTISTLKREGYTPTRYSDLVTIYRDEYEIQKPDLKSKELQDGQKTIDKNLDLIDIYQKYQTRLTELGLFDYDDMINWVVESFETDPEFLLEYQEMFQYLLVDEYQDTNSAQNRLLFALTSYWGEQANIFAVGDPNQSIYRFQGASRENIIQFQKAYPQHVQIILDQNYRSTPTILASSAHLISSPPLSSNTTLTDTPIKVAKFSSSVLEDEFLVRSIKRHLKSGIPASDIAIITKDNRDIDNLVSLFKSHGLSYRLSSGVDILKTPLVSQFLRILQVVTSIQGPVDDIDLFTVLGYPYFGVEPLAIFRASRLAYQDRKTLVDTLLNRPDDIDPHLSSVYQKIISWHHQAGHKTLPQIFEIILHESGLMSHILSLPQSVIELNRFHTLFEDAKQQASAYPNLDLFGYVTNLVTMEQNHIKLEEKLLSSDIDAVTLTTAHKSKGLEWQVVYVYRFADTHWGNKMSRDMIRLVPGIINFEDLEAEEDKNSEERRIFYVAMTRAKRQLYLTGSTIYDKSARMIFPAIFLHHLPEESLSHVDTSKSARRLAKIITQRLAPDPVVIADDEQSYIKEILENFKLSPTALNSYLVCPYRFKLDNLYRIPKAKAPAMCFGTAVHHALELLYRELNASGKLKSREDFIADFETALIQEILTPEEHKARLAHGRKVLTGYYEHYQTEFQACLFTEKNFGSSSTLPVMLDDIPLTGKADRIDRTSQSEPHVRFVDYKTGRVKTRGEIEGTTKSSDGDYFRQLTFYHLLADLDKSFPYQVVQTELDFIEPDASGKYRKERFNITPDHVAQLRQTIKSTMADIRALKFPRTADTKHCQNCPFKAHCYPDSPPPPSLSEN
jgi:DNA helicase II / ATP-dependent DNA helicase PcrA